MNTPICLSAELVADLREYLDNRADIDNEGGPNAAMRLLTRLDAEDVAGADAGYEARSDKRFGGKGHGRFGNEFS